MDAKKYTAKLQVYLTEEDYDTLKGEAETDHRKAGEWARVQLEKILKKNQGTAKKLYQLVEA